MNGRGGCCIARYGSTSAAVHDVSKIDQIMLRYRPIAPKPATSEEVSKAMEIDTCCARTVRGRRRRNTAPKQSSNSSSGSGELNSNSSGDNKRCGKRKSGVQDGNTEKLSSKSEVQDNTVVTLPLLPETPDLTATVSRECYMWPRRQKRVVGSWVTYTWGAALSLGRSS